VFSYFLLCFFSFIYNKTREGRKYSIEKKRGREVRRKREEKDEGIIGAITRNGNVTS
jgi:hypothetical protein